MGQNYDIFRWEFLESEKNMSKIRIISTWDLQDKGVLLIFDNDDRVFVSYDCLYDVYTKLTDNRIDTKQEADEDDEEDFESMVYCLQDIIHEKEDEISELKDQHQQDCIEINRLNVTIETLVKKYGGKEFLRDME